MSKFHTFKHGFTLVEMLVSLAVLSVLMLAFTQVFGGSLRASGQLNGRNELISEGQVAQQLIASRLQSAYYVYPAGTVLQFTTSGGLAKNTVRSGANYTWTVGTDPIVALIVPPRIAGLCPTIGTSPADKDACFTFYAYYPVLRSELIRLNPNSGPDADPQNGSAWILMEYKANLLDGVTRGSVPTPDCAGTVTGTRSGPDALSCPPNPETVRTNGSAVQPNIRGQNARMLIDYVQPTTVAPTYTLFTTCEPGAVPPAPTGCPAGTPATDPRWAELDLRMRQRRGGRDLTAPSSNAPLTSRVYPRNWN